MARIHYAEVTYDIGEFDDDELIAEMKLRSLDYNPPKNDPLLYELYLARVEGNAVQFEKALQKLFLDRLDKRI
jgi:hypothetical protein